MNLETVIKEVRDLLSQFVFKVKANTALELTDLNRHSEGFLLELLRELYVIPGLRNLNLEKTNFPGLDLGDDSTGRAFQITATADLSKVKDTLKTVIGEKLHSRFPRVQVFILTEKQTTYSQSAIDQITAGALQFNAAKDIIDYRDVLSTCAHLELDHLIRVRDVLTRHLVTSPSGTIQLAQTVSIPEGYETVELNIAPIWLPTKVYLASYMKPVSIEGGGVKRHRKHRANPRQEMVNDILARRFDVPEDFEIHAGQIVTFQNIAEKIPVLEPYFDSGTVSEIGSGEFFGIDDDHLRVFKSLLRRCLQRQLRDAHVLWQHEKHLFFFGPIGEELERKVSWTGQKAAERVVYKRTMKNNKPDEILNCKHLAFYVGFELIEKAWYIKITPTWYFSRDGYREDRFGADRISWLKRQENNLQVRTHYHFILSQLQELQERSLFDRANRGAQIQVGEPKTFSNHPVLPDQLWNPKKASEEDAQGIIPL